MRETAPPTVAPPAEREVIRPPTPDLVPHPWSSVVDTAVESPPSNDPTSPDFNKSSLNKPSVLFQSSEVEKMEEILGRLLVPDNEVIKVSYGYSNFFYSFFYLYENFNLRCVKLLILFFYFCI